MFHDAVAGTTDIIITSLATKYQLQSGTWQYLFLQVETTGRGLSRANDDFSIPASIILFPLIIDVAQMTMFLRASSLKLATLFHDAFYTRTTKGRVGTWLVYLLPSSR